MESTGLWAAVARTATDPQYIASRVNLNIEFFWRRTQKHSCKIKPIPKPKIKHYNQNINCN